MSEAAINNLYDQSERLTKFLDEHEEPSLRIFVDEHLAKILVLAAASRFEKCMTEAVLELAKRCLTADHPLVALIEQKGVKRQYHQWFDWEASNANRFFGLFGKNFSEYAKRTMMDDEGLRKSMHRFLELGSYRNRLVHQDYVTFPMTNDFEEAYRLYDDASKFVEWFQRAACDGLKAPLPCGQNIPEDVTRRSE